MNLTILHRARRVIEKADKGGAVWAPFRAVLLVCSWIYGIVFLVRRFLYRHVPGMRKRVAAHVISVGNITVGGAGKTPIVEMYATFWLQNGRKVAIVSRGYGKAKRLAAGSGLPDRIRPPRGVRVVSDGRGHIFLSAGEAGDEPYLLAKRIPAAIVLVSRSRYAACRFAVREFGAEVIVLDDAFQHLRLHRDEDIVAVDATNPFGNGRLIPRGMLRELPASLGRASRVLLTKILPGNDMDNKDGALGTRAKVRLAAPGVPISVTRYVPTHLSSAPGGETASLGYLEGKSVVAFCGIADHGFFERTVEYVGARTLRAQRFPDHYWYTPADLASIDETAAECNADAIVTTEKDMVRLPDTVVTRCPLYAVAVEVRIED